MIKIEKVKVRKILNSVGNFTFEIEIVDKEGRKATASSPKAIQSGKREAIITKELNIYIFNQLIDKLCEKEIESQKQFDTLIYEYINQLGSDICLSLSLAFARIMAQKEQISLVKYIAKIALYNTNYKMPKPLVTVFSGGVHNTKNKDTIQNIMLSINKEPFSKAIIPIQEIYTKIEQQLKEKGQLRGYGASSGMLVNNMTTEQKFEMAFDAIKKLGYEKEVTLAIDVAAEHFFRNHKYEYEGKERTPKELKEIITNYKEKYNLTYIEDPFDSEDEQMWYEFKKENTNLAIVGDDLFATQNQYIDVNLANGIIIKMNQIGTLSGTIETFMRAKKENMITCVSHRSIETEDTFMCDLAVAFDADYIKIGGPRRGDRIIKYNQLLRLEEERKC